MIWPGEICLDSSLINFKIKMPCNGEFKEEGKTSFPKWQTIRVSNAKCTIWNRELPFAIFKLAPASGNIPLCTDSNTVKRK